MKSEVMFVFSSYLEKLIYFPIVMDKREVPVAFREMENSGMTVVL